MAELARTPEPPYVAVIFTSVRTDGDLGYGAMAARMDELVVQQDGYLGHDTARADVGITVSYWCDEAAALAWKAVTAHLAAQQRGRARWYADYEVRVATVHRAYSRATSRATSGLDPADGHQR